MVSDQMNPGPDLILEKPYIIDESSKSRVRELRQWCRL